MQLSAMATQPSAGQQGGTGGAKAETGVGRGGKGGGGEGGTQEGICHGAGPVSTVIGSLQWHYDAAGQHDHAHG